MEQVTQEWERQGFKDKEHWLHEGQCARCHDVWDDERGMPILSVAETPPNTTEAMRKNLHNARRLIGKPLCEACQSKLQRKPGGDLITFNFVQ